MNYTFTIFTVFIVLAACNHVSKTINEPTNIDATRARELAEANEQAKRYSFGNISQIVADSSYSTWVYKHDSSYSLALHFQGKDTIAVSYSPECWLVFPCKLDKNQLTVYWDDNIDTKYEFDIVKAVKSIDNKYIGKVFMTLELFNDTTLRATYILKELRTTINSSNKRRIFFPDKFTLVQKGEMYD